MAGINVSSSSLGGNPDGKCCFWHCQSWFCLTFVYRVGNWGSVSHDVCFCFNVFYGVWPTSGQPEDLLCSRSIHSSFNPPPPPCSCTFQLSPLSLYMIAWIGSFTYSVVVQFRIYYNISPSCSVYFQQHVAKLVQSLCPLGNMKSRYNAPFIATELCHWKIMNFI